MKNSKHDYSHPNNPPHQHACWKRMLECVTATARPGISARRLRQLRGRISYLIRLKPTLPLETNARGSIILRDDFADNVVQEGLAKKKVGEERYLYDFKACTRARGWQQWDTDQDAWYFGVWVHPEKRWTFTYAEGDRTLVQCPTAEIFKAEIADAEKFYGKAPPAFISYDQPPNGGPWTRTKYYDTRLSAANL